MSVFIDIQEYYEYQYLRMELNHRAWDIANTSNSHAVGMDTKQPPFSIFFYNDTI